MKTDAIPNDIRLGSRVQNATLPRREHDFGGQIPAVALPEMVSGDLSNVFRTSDAGRQPERPGFVEIHVCRHQQIAARQALDVSLDAGGRAFPVSERDQNAVTIEQRIAGTNSLKLLHEPREIRSNSPCPLVRAGFQHVDSFEKRMFAASREHQIG